MDNQCNLARQYELCLVFIGKILPTRGGFVPYADLGNPNSMHEHTNPIPILHQMVLKQLSSRSSNSLKLVSMLRLLLPKDIYDTRSKMGLSFHHGKYLLCVMNEFANSICFINWKINRKGFLTFADAGNKNQKFESKPNPLSNFFCITGIRMKDFCALLPPYYKVDYDLGRITYTETHESEQFSYTQIVSSVKTVEDKEHIESTTTTRIEYFKWCDEDECGEESLGEVD